MIELIYSVTKWFSVGWWRYLLSSDEYGSYVGESVPERLSHLLCRVRNHPNGVVWYNPNGLEPDMRCKDCGDEL